MNSYTGNTASCASGGFMNKDHSHNLCTQKVFGEFLIRLDDFEWIQLDKMKMPVIDILGLVWRISNTISSIESVKLIICHFCQLHTCMDTSITLRSNFDSVIYLVLVITDFRKIHNVNE